MKSEILQKLKSLLETENILSVQREFKQLSAQFRSLVAHGITDIDESDDDHEDDLHDDEVSPDNQVQSISVEDPAPIQTQEQTPASTSEEEQQPATEEKKDTDSLPEETPQPSTPIAEETSAISQPEEKAEPSTSVEVEDVSTSAAPPAETESTAEAAQQDSSEKVLDPTEPTEVEKVTYTMEEAVAEFKKLMDLFKEKTAKQREIRKQIEKETILTAKDLLKELESLVENEENIAKAFSGFNAIQDKWRSLPKVSNESYRELNAEYNKFAEQFFYNINIYKELKELDLKRNLEQKELVLQDQKKLLDVNDIRRMEVEVRLNQDRWNEIGPTFKEDWDKIKDEFWNVTRSIYKKIQDFYTQRREQQEKNLELKLGLLNRLKQIASLDLKSHKKWQEKTADVINLQKEWKMIGYVPKERTDVWKEFRSLSDEFFDKKRSFYQETRKEQNANRDLKMALVKRAEELQDSEDWNATSAALIELQNQWKTIGPAHQRDENRMWRKFRQACDNFFQRRKAHRSEEAADFEKNLELKKALIAEMQKFEPGPDRNKSIETLKEFSEKWRNIGHVPFKQKDKVNKEYKKVLDEKFKLLKIDQREKEKIRFEQKLEDLKEIENNEHLVRKEQDNIRGKISKLENEAIQLETNIGFFADTKGTEKLRAEVERKIEKVRNEIEILKQRLQRLNEAI